MLQWRAYQHSLDKHSQKDVEIRHVTYPGGGDKIPIDAAIYEHEISTDKLYCILLYLQPVLNPKSYDGPQVLEASSRPLGTDKRRRN